MNIVDIRQRLLQWFRKNARDLPWRRSPTLYKTVVSEFMLQQTQVKTVLPYFERWMQLFPDFETLAYAPQDRVLHAWAGLGYYSRAHHLQALAQSFIKKPACSYAEFSEYKGVGPYTAAAIASIAFNEPVTVVDGNVIRVLARLYFQKEPFKTKDQAVQWAKPLAQLLLDPKFPGQFNEAVMELGAVICTKKSLRCASCPLQLSCKAYANKEQESCPQFFQTQRQKKSIRRLWLQNSHSALLLEPSSVGGSHSLLELPLLTVERELFFKNLQKIFQGRRSIGMTDYSETIYRCSILSDTPTNAFKMLFPNARFYTYESLTHCALSGPHRRWIHQIYKKLQQEELF